MTTLSGEFEPIRRQIVPLSTKYMENYIGGPLRVDARSIGTSLWRSMIRQTQADSIERGLVVGKMNKEFLTSEIYKGSGRKEIFDGFGMRMTGGSFTPPFFPHFIQSLNPWTKDIVVVHSHAMPPPLDHLPTTIISDADILTFNHSRYHALCAIDRGGAHLLIRTKKQPHSNTPYAHLVRDSINETVKKNGGINDAILEVSNRLWQFGLAYLYTSQLDADPDATITFQQPTK